MNIQEEIQNIHRQYGITELANYKIQQLFEKYAKEYCKEQFAKFEEYASSLTHNRDGYSRAKIIELLIEKAKELFVIKNDNVPTGFIDDDILNKAIDRWGVNSQREMVIEECLELALAIQKLKRKRGNYEEKMKHVIDEIADVKIVSRQAELMFGPKYVGERVDFKMNRLVESILEDKE